MSDYEILKAYGFSAFKAAEIALDVKRGDIRARQWLELARRSASETR